MPKPIQKGKKSKTQKKQKAMYGGVSPKKSKTPQNSKNCALCHQSLSTIVGQSEIAEIGLNCGHKFHKNCLEPYMNSMKGKCPICKKNI